MKGVFFSTKLPELTEIRDFEIPTPGDDEILIKNVAVASNPKDWKLPIWKGKEIIEGNDVAGHVESVGKDVTEFKKGDKVAAFSKMGHEDKYGAYAEYTVAPARTSRKLAASTSFEDAATLPLAVMTAHLALFTKLNLTLPPEDGSIGSNKNKTVIINGASSSVGSFAIQLAKRAGYRVLAVAGSSKDIVTSLGADAIVDYRGKDQDALVKAVQAEIDDKTSPVAGTFDAVSIDDTAAFLAQVIQPNGGIIATVLPLKDPGLDNVKISNTMVGTAYGETYGDDTEFAAKWYRIIGKWLDDGSFKPNKVKLLPNGLDSVNEGIHLLKANKVNGVKLVYRIADSKCIQ